MSSEPQTPIMRQIMPSKQPLAKPFLITLAETPMPFSPMTPDPWHIADQPTNPMPAITTVAKPWQQHVHHPLSPTPPLSHQKQQHKQRKPRKKRLALLLAVCCLMTMIAGIFTSQGNGVAGAWMADSLRAGVGPMLTAQIESWYLGLSNTASQAQYQLGSKQVNAPWKVSTVQSPTPTPTPPAWSTLSPMPLPSMTPLVSPALADEGVWTAQENAPAPYNYLPLDAKAFIRPDPSHPYAIVTLLQFDNRFTLLHIIGGTNEPGGPRGVHGPGVIPASALKENGLLAAFNGGFKYSDGQYGLMADGMTYVPPQPGAATIAITKEGHLILGAWGIDPLLNSQNTDLVAWRQNAALLINQGVINPLTHDGAAWGGTILNSAYTWRSAIGITAQGTLLYAAGNALTAETLGEALKAAGAVMAMQTDINPFWVRAFLYDHDSTGKLTISKLDPQMQGTGYEYLYSNQRDFFYLTRFAPAVPPVDEQPPKKS